STLTLPSIGTFSDPGFDNPDNPNGASQETFTFSINWGDGTAQDSGSATVDTPGSAGTPTSGHFGGSHVFADDGAYTVTVTVPDDNGGSDQKTFTVTVTNVAPKLTVAQDQAVKVNKPLSLSQIGSFTDPGFDNPNKPGGATSESFTFTVNWG